MLINLHQISNFKKKKKAYIKMIYQKIGILSKKFQIKYLLLKNKMVGMITQNNQTKFV